MNLYAYTGNDHIVRFSGGQTVVLTTGEAIALDAAATVQFSIQTVEYEDILGETWPVTMQYLSGSPGNYIGVLRDSVQLEAGRSYRFIATVSNGVDAQAVWDIPLHVLDRV